MPQQAAVSVCSALVSGATASTAASATNKPNTVLRATSPCPAGSGLTEQVPGTQGTVLGSGEVEPGRAWLAVSGRR